MFRHWKDMQAGEQSNPLSRESLSHCLPLERGTGGGGGGWGEETDDISDHVKHKNSRLKRSKRCK